MICPICNDDVDNLESHKDQEHSALEIYDDVPEVDTVEENSFDEIYGDNKVENEGDDNTDEMETIDEEPIFGENRDNKKHNDRVLSFENLGFTQGDSMQMADLNWVNLSTEVQNALEVEEEEKEEKREEDTDIFNDESSQPDTQIEEEDGIHYNIINETQTTRTNYECEWCNSGFKSNEGLLTHFNDTHVQAKANEFSIDVPLACPFCMADLGENETMADHLAYQHGIVSGSGLEEEPPITDQIINQPVIEEEFLDPMVEEEQIAIENDEDGDELDKFIDVFNTEENDEEDDVYEDIEDIAKDTAEEEVNMLKTGDDYTKDHDYFGNKSEEGFKKKIKGIEVFSPTQIMGTEDFKEEEHPREEGGKFTSKGGVGAKAKPTKQKTSKGFDKAKTRALKIMGEPKSDWDRKEYNSVKNLDGYPTHSSQLRGVKAGAKASIMKAHLHDAYDEAKFSVRKRDYNSIDAGWKGGGAYPYGAGKLVDVYSNRGQTNSQVDYFDTDTYVFSVGDDRPDRPEMDPWNVADSREQRFGEWINRQINEDWSKYAAQYSGHVDLGVSTSIAKTMLEEPEITGLDKIKFSDFTELKNDFLKQEIKEGGGQLPKDLPLATTPAFQTQQYMGEDPDKPRDIPIDPKTGAELPVSKFNPQKGNYPITDATKETPADIDRAHKQMLANKIELDKPEGSTFNRAGQPWQRKGESLNDVYKDIEDISKEEE